MSERQNLLTSIAQTVRDYRDWSLPKPISDHVERWVQQFDANVQLPILREIDHVLKNTYFSKEKVSKFIRTAIRTTKLTGSSPKDFWRSANFLDIQGGGDSQTDMLALFSEMLREEFGIGIEDCGQANDVFIYLDDGIFTGNRVRRDLESWVRDLAPAQATVHVICIALHSG
ncbi:MAG: phosphoribosyltransferase-like protein, partial [Halothiobacillaceae bacterium]